ncbi:hypothetical protein RJ640_019067 [Escallonia rubra]|uniref:PB1 domain-containing protein n=1 Tax=Escallonia rubra TaxID=112253 RepID=A0AA88S3K7_9ASTE|nr:hypothetical protein RJ640_019067 [Escallonia rubra]
MADKDTNVGASGVAEENVVVERGRDLLPPIGGKKGRSQSKSRDAISSLDDRTCVLEEAMGDAKDRLGFVEQNLQTLEDHVLEELESLKKAVVGEDELRTRFMELFANLQEQLDVEFTTLMLHIPNMTEEDLLFNFIDGLQNWAKQELQRRGVKDLDEAIAMAESLMEYARVGDSSKGKNVQVASKGNHAKGGGDKPKAWNKGKNQAGTNKSEGQGKLEERRAKSKPKDRCFFCGGPHWARDCPRQGKLNALVEENEELEEGDVHMGSLQILNALHAKAVAKVPTGEGQASTGKGLLYVEAKMNGKPAQVMVDTRATHNFVTMEEAKRLGLKVVGGGGWLKSVNTNAKTLQGAARQVEMCLGSWRGLVDFSVAPMDDFKVVIGLDFMRLLDVAQFSYNLMRSEATNQSPFEIAIGQKPLTPLALAGDYKGRSPLAAQVARSWNEQADVARSYLDKAGRKMKKWADKRRRPKEYNLGDMVMLKLLPQQFKSFRKVHKGLIRRYEGPFPIVAKVGKVSYRLELPPKLKIHPVFHVSLLKPHHNDKEDPSRGESHRAPTAVVRSYDKEAEYVLSDKIERRRGQGTRTGPPGRVFRHKLPESSPDVSRYSCNEFPLRDVAENCGFKSMLTLPLLERSSRGRCIGVLEIVAFNYGSLCSELLSMVPWLQNSDGHLHAKDEIENMLIMVQDTYGLPLAQSLRPGQGIVWNALRSHRPYFCSDISKLSMTEYPLAHYAHEYDLTTSFVISMRSSYTGDLDYVLEFFLSTKNYKDDKTLLGSILATMKQHLKSFKVSSGKELGEVLIADIVEVSTLTDELRSSSEVEVVQENSSSQQSTPEETSENGVEQSKIALTSLQKQCLISKREKDITYEDLKPYLRMTTLDHVAEIFGGIVAFSRSKMKRSCRTVGILEWPSCKRKKVKPTHSNLKNLNENVQSIEERILESSKKDPLCDDNRRMHEASLVTIKATYADVIIKFRLSSSSTMAELSENLTERLPLTSGSFHTKYQDDEGDWVLLACEKDLQYCLTSLGSSVTIKMRVQPISYQMT